MYPANFSSVSLQYFIIELQLFKLVSTSALAELGPAQPEIVNLSIQIFNQNHLVSTLTWLSLAQLDLIMSILFWPNFPLFNHKTNNYCGSVYWIIDFTMILPINFSFCHQEEKNQKDKVWLNEKLQGF